MPKSNKNKTISKKNKKHSNYTTPNKYKTIFKKSKKSKKGKKSKKNKQNKQK